MLALEGSHIIHVSLRGLMDPKGSLEDHMVPTSTLNVFMIPMWHTQVLYLIIELTRSLQKPNVKIEDTSLALDMNMMKAYLYPIQA